MTVTYYRVERFSNGRKPLPRLNPPRATLEGDGPGKERISGPMRMSESDIAKLEPGKNYEFAASRGDGSYPASGVATLVEVHEDDVTLKIQRIAGVNVGIEWALKKVRIPIRNLKYMKPLSGGLGPPANWDRTGI